MNWLHLTNAAELEQAHLHSKQTPVIIFKHSTRCSISRTALDRLQRQWNEQEMEKVKAYFLDLISYRQISNQIADYYNIDHESPQVLVIKDGKVVFHRSHLGIDYAGIREIVRS